MHSAFHDRIEFGEASERAGVGFCDPGASEGCFRFPSFSDRISSDRRSQGCCEQREANRPDGQELKKRCGAANAARSCWNGRGDTLRGSIGPGDHPRAPTFPISMVVRNRT